MLRYFAEINSLTNEVIRVIVCNDKNWCETNLGGIWIETYKYSSDKKCAGKGMIYYQDKDNFASKQPYPSWTLDENCDWQPPIVIPNLTEEDKDNNKYYCSELIHEAFEKDSVFITSRRPKTAAKTHFSRFYVHVFGPQTI